MLNLAKTFTREGLYGLMVHRAQPEEMTPFQRAAFWIEAAGRGAIPLNQPDSDTRKELLRLDGAEIETPSAQAPNQMFH